MYRLINNRNKHIVEVFLIVASILLAAVSFAILLDLTPLPPSRSVCITLIAINLASVVILSFAIVYRVVPIFLDWRAGKAASRLHFRIIALFSGVASLPALVVAIVAVITFNMGLDRWFNNNTQQIVNSSINIANVYAAETLNSLNYNAHYMREALDNPRLLKSNLLAYRRLMSLQAIAYNLRGAFLLGSEGQIYVSSYSKDNEKLPIPPKELILQAKNGSPFPFQPGKHDYFGMIVKLNHIPNTYLYVVKQVHSSVLRALRLTEYNTNRYKEMQLSRVPLQLAFAVLYLCLFLTMLLCAVLTGLNIANKLVRPIRRLITAADRVAQGDLNFSLPKPIANDDVGQLSKTFNYMVRELKIQRDELLRVNNIIDYRRRFSEAVLAGVTVGVLGVNSKGKITIANRSLEQMFSISKKDWWGKTIEEFSKIIGGIRINEIFDHVRLRYKTFGSEQISVDSNGIKHVYHVQITGENSVHSERSWVITIDDITDLVEAHRSLAWADVARRIAHEIKNPLTPIQLSAERIRRRYAQYIVQDKDIFDKCLDTIIRQVNDIGRMVNEFSAFSRMPKPNIEIVDIRKPLEEASFLVEVSKNHITFDRDLGTEPIFGAFDRRLISQALGNIIKNASEAVDAANTLAQKAGKNYYGHIAVTLKKHNNKIVIKIMDNGVGWPVEKRERLLEPYITTRAKGTGLGLAIAKKIVEDHQGLMELCDAPKEFYKGVGAMVKLTFPVVVDLEKIDKNNE